MINIKISIKQRIVIPVLATIFIVGLFSTSASALASIQYAPYGPYRVITSWGQLPMVNYSGFSEDSFNGIPAVSTTASGTFGVGNRWVEYSGFKIGNNTYNLRISMYSNSNSNRVTFLKRHPQVSKSHGSVMCTFQWIKQSGTDDIDLNKIAMLLNDIDPKESLTVPEPASSMYADSTIPFSGLILRDYYVGSNAADQGCIMYKGINNQSIGYTTGYNNSAFTMWYYLYPYRNLSIRTADMNKGTINGKVQSVYEYDLKSSTPYSFPAKIEPKDGYEVSYMTCDKDLETKYGETYKAGTRLTSSMVSRVIMDEHKVITVHFKKSVGGLKVDKTN